MSLSYFKLASAAVLAAAILPACAAPSHSGAYKMPSAQLGPRPFFLVNDMLDSKLKRELNACAITRECTGFSKSPSPVATSMKRCRSCVSCRPSGHCTGMLNGRLIATAPRKTSG